MPSELTPQRDALPSRWRGMREIFDRMDASIAEVYAELGIVGVRPRFSMAIMFLEGGPLSIRELSREVNVTHSAMSQTVSAMKKDGLIRSAPGTDARNRMIELTPAGRALIEPLRAEWYATEAVLAELDAEVPYALGQLISDLRAALDRRSFTERLRIRLQLGERS
ncbi:MAG TPA: MarR family transcriptional regulator [Galbitalea sp.]|jgi:DNA-binding MarR family transcriptional regulator|nr:MarR family transcriptional regulator [Galbitalea sp.]